jgi:hypothetical protein
VTQLFDGETQSGSVLKGTPDVYAYYYFSNPSRNANISITLTPLTGDSDLYVLPWTTLSARPSRFTYAWRSTAVGTDVVNIKSNDPNACGSCDYIIAVFCFLNSPCQYSISGSSWQGVRLVDGQPLSGMVSKNGMAFYSLNLGSNAGAVNVSFTVAPLSGDAQLYITNSYIPGSAQVGQLPSTTWYNWTSAGAGGVGGTHQVYIPFTDPKVNAGLGLYTIGVYGTATSNTLFTVSATSSLSRQIILPGVPSTPAVIASGASQQYAVTVDTTRDLVIAATYLSGVVDIAVSSPWRQNPTCTGSMESSVTCDAVWSTQTMNANYEGVVLRIPAANPCSGPGLVPTGDCNAAVDWKPGPFLVAAYGGTSQSASQYVLTVFQGASVQQLGDGVPQSGATSNQYYPVYSLQVPYMINLPDVHFSISSDNMPMNVYIYGCIDTDCTQSNMNPSGSNFQFFASVESSGQADVFITKYSTNYCTDPVGQELCNYFISVQPAGTCANPPCVGTFTLTGGVQNGVVANNVLFTWFLNSVFTMPGTVALGSSSLYAIYFQNSRISDLLLNLDACDTNYPTLYGTYARVCVCARLCVFSDLAQFVSQSVCVCHCDMNLLISRLRTRPIFYANNS